MIGVAVYQWCELKSHRGKNKKLSAQRSNSNTVLFNFQTYIYESLIVFKGVPSNFFPRVCISLYMKLSRNHKMF